MKILYLPNCYSQQRQREKKRKIYPVLMAMEAERYRQQGHKVGWDNSMWNVDYNEVFIWSIKQLALGKWNKIVHEPEGLPFLSLPPPDRQFTRWWEYQDNGNFKYHPATYMMVASGCWWGKCKFCVEQKNKYEVRPVESVIEEIEQCQRMGFREIFDDSGTFPTGRWLDDFLNKFTKSTSSISISCNMRLIATDFVRLNGAGFRMVLFGIESANQKTLDRINKGTKEEDVKYVIKASKAGLEPHITVMFGYPWETDTDANRTLKLVHYLLRKGYAKTAQASFYTPRNSEQGNENHRKYVGQIYRVAYSPTFWLNKLRDIKDIDDIKYFWKMIKEGINGYYLRKS